MTVLVLTTAQHQEVLKKLLELACSVEGTEVHQDGLELTSLMACFFMHQVSTVKALFAMLDKFPVDSFLATAGYILVRSLFETDVTAHYLLVDSKARVRKYIEFEHITRKHQMDACYKHKCSENASWREGLSKEWNDYWSVKEQEVNTEYTRVRPLFLDNSRKKTKKVRNWSGKSIRQMAKEVHHEEAYDVFYSHLSSFTHVDVNLANKYLQSNGKYYYSSIHASELDVGFVFRYAAIFFTCFLELFGKEFDVWTKANVMECWKFMT